LKAIILPAFRKLIAPETNRHSLANKDPDYLNFNVSSLSNPYQRGRRSSMQPIIASRRIWRSAAARWISAPRQPILTGCAMSIYVVQWESLRP
jgi:hypothetical protein